MASKKQSRRVRFPEFETVNTHDDVWVAYTEYKGMPVTAYEHNREAAEAKAREYINRHYRSF